MAIYTLPDLDYDYSALEPYISAEIMQLAAGDAVTALIKAPHVILAVE